ncbi:MAG TPA: hypothetical protein DEF42_14855 [Desulfosporosinus sp.]|nr:hypothetical protein [Desulfosporosinus sp.]
MIYWTLLDRCLDREINTKASCYHNGAESYYAARGFRGSLSV